jgi:hypothetical protein
MAKKILLAGLAGGAVVFLVSAFFHMATSLGEYGIKTFPNEDVTIAAMRSSVPESGLYLFPGAGMSSHPSPAEQAAYLQKYKAGPTGILVVSRGGTDFNFGKLLFLQFLMGLVGSLLLAWVLGITAGATTYGSRVLLVLLASLFAGFVYAMPYWNWYDFPLDYTIAYVATWCASWVAAGLAMAAIVRPQAAAT